VATIAPHQLGISDVDSLSGTGIVRAALFDPHQHRTTTAIVCPAV
jgi:hypothetical protein